MPSRRPAFLQNVAQGVLRVMKAVDVDRPVTADTRESSDSGEDLRVGVLAGGGTPVDTDTPHHGSVQAVSGESRNQDA